MENRQLSVTAGEALAAGRVVGFNGQYADDETVSPAGVTTSVAESGEVLAVMRGGIVEMESSGAIAQGALVAAGANGVAVSGAALTDTCWFLGTAVKAATGNRVLVALNFQYIPTPAA